MKQTNHKIWRISSVLTLILALFVSSTTAQPTLPTIPNGTLTAFPVNFQLYPRQIIPDATPDFGVVTVAGSIQSASGFSSLSLRVLRDDAQGAPYNYVLARSISIPLNFVGNTATFSITDNLTAELRDYRYELVGINGTTNPIIAASERILAGDAFIVQGQSNALAERRLDGDANAEQNSQYIRSYGSPDERGYSFSTSSWGVADGNGNFRTNYAIGMWAMRLATRITQTESIPIAVINGGYGSDIIYFTKSFTQPPQNYGTNQNPNFLPNDGSNNYLRLQKRVVDAGLSNRIRAIFWWQGESEIYLSSTNNNLYANRFTSIFQNWELDYPGFQKCFLIQVRLGCYLGSSVPINTGLEIMQTQLDLSKLNGKIEIISTQNLEHIFESNPSPGWFCHYGYSDGYRKAGDLFLPIVRQELYNLPYSNNSRSSFPIAADVTSATGQPPTQITVELNNPNDTYSIIPLTGSNIANYFRVEGGSGGYDVTSVQIDGKNIRINFTNPNSGIPTAVSYYGRQQFDAPVIENSGGHAVVAFTQPIVGGSLPIDPLLLTVSRTGGAHQLRWKAESNERFDQFVVERGETRNSFKPIYEVYGTGQSGTIQYDFTDNKPNATVSHYRIRAIQQDGRELFSQVVTVNNRLNNVKEFRVYPNPVAGSANATINMNEAALATINLHDASGRLLSSRKLQLQKGNNQFSLGELLDYNPGTYIVRVVTATETQQIRVVKAK